MLTLSPTHTSFTGSLPASLGHSPLMKQIRVDNNQLSGVLPDTVRDWEMQVNTDQVLLLP